MADCFLSYLENRGVLSVSGDDATAFLQGLVSNDMDRVSGSRVIWAAFLTPQGKFLHEFMIAQLGDRYLLECEKDRRDDLETRLKRFRLRAKVTIDSVDDLAVAAAWGPGVSEAFELPSEPGSARTEDDAVLFMDPRLADAGVRIIAPVSSISGLDGVTRCTISDQAAYDTHRIALGLPDGSRDLEVEKALLLENGFEELSGIDFEKGCYIGQELTARTHYRALIKKRLMPVTIEGPPPPPGTALTVEGKDAGEMKSSANGFGLALVRLATWRASEDGILRAGEARLTPEQKSWMTLPDSGDGEP